MMEKLTQDPPKFAVVGKVNAGKSSVLATLLEVDDDQLLRISATPGETTECQEFPVSFDKQEWIRFIDTPGFSRPIEAMKAIQELAPEGKKVELETLKKFVVKYQGSGEFEDECRLLGPMLEGSGLLYVIDPSKPLREAFIAEMEILRWTGQPRLALLNRKGESDEFLQDWKTKLGSYFNLVRTFNAHTAKYEERVRLIRSLLEIDEAHSQAIETVLEYLELEWDQRREESAEAIISFLEKALTHRATVPITERDMSVESRKERKLKQLSEEYSAKIVKMEEKAHSKIMKLYRHHLVSVEQNSSNYDSLDLFAEETWEKWGLNRAQLAMAGGATGAAGGLLVDIGTGGFTHGWGTLLGAVSGAAAAFFKGGELPDFGMSIGGGLKMETGDGTSLSVGPPKNDNFAWILLDSCLNFYSQILNRAHAKRDQVTIQHDGNSITRTLKSSERKPLAKWFDSCAKGKPDRGMEPEVFAALNQIMAGLGKEQ